MEWDRVEIFVTDLFTPGFFFSASLRYCLHGTKDLGILQAVSVCGQKTEMHLLNIDGPLNG